MHRSKLIYKPWPVRKKRLKVLLDTINRQEVQIVYSSGQGAVVSKVSVKYAVTVYLYTIYQCRLVLAVK